MTVSPVSVTAHRAVRAESSAAARWLDSDQGAIVARTQSWSQGGGVLFVGVMSENKYEMSVHVLAELTTEICGEDMEYGGQLAIVTSRSSILARHLRVFVRSMMEPFELILCFSGF